MSKLTEFVFRTWATKTTAAEMEAEFRLLQKQAVELYHAEKTDKVVLDHAGKVITGTLVEGSRAELDMDSLAERLTPEQLAMVQVKVIDKDLLEAAVKLGQIDLDTVEQCTEIRPSSAYLRFTVKEGAAQVAPIKKVAKKAAKKVSK